MTVPISDERIREIYTMATKWTGLSDKDQPEHIVFVRNTLRHEFDTWLAEHDRMVAVRAWDEGRRAAFQDEFGDLGQFTPNPYMIEEN